VEPLTSRGSGSRPTRSDRHGMEPLLQARLHRVLGDVAPLRRYGGRADS
jgi:hypothetical protein